jgi:hypothetical protein
MPDRQEKLEQMFMQEFLHSHGLSWETVNALPEAERRKILTDASTYVSLKLAEVEGKARISEELHGLSKMD